MEFIINSEISFPKSSQNTDFRYKITAILLYQNDGYSLAEQQGFEPWRRFHALRDFESRLFDQLEYCSITESLYQQLKEKSILSLSKSLFVGATLGCPQILQSKIRSPQGENMVISLREIRKTPFFGGRSRIAPTGSKRFTADPAPQNTASWAHTALPQSPGR